MNTHRIPSRLQILGVGSDKNRRLRSNLEQALQQLDMDLAIEEIQDLDRLLEYKLKGIPALVVNGRVAFQQDVPTVEEIAMVLRALVGQQRLLGQVDEIVATIDFSEASLNALSYARSLADAQGLPLELVYVEPPVAHPAGTEIQAPMPPWDRLQLLAKEIQATGLPTAARLLKGYPAEELVHLAQHGGKLLVMGSRGKGNTAHPWMGSVSYQVAQTASCPVMVIPEDRQFQGFHTMVYASSYQPAEETILPQAVDLASWFHARLFFVHLNGSRLEAFTLQPPGAPQAGAEIGHLVKLGTVQHAHTGEGLLHYVQELEADLLMIASSRENLIDRMAPAPDATTDMLWQLNVPLLIFALT